MHFWQEVTDCELYKDSTADRRVRASRASDIFNKYISPDAACSIGESMRCSLRPRCGAWAFLCRHCIDLQHVIDGVQR